MAFAKGRSYPILLSMAKKDPQAKRLLDKLNDIEQEEFEQEFGQLLNSHPEFKSDNIGYEAKQKKVDESKEQLKIKEEIQKRTPREAKIVMSEENFEKLKPVINEIFQRANVAERFVTNALSSKVKQLNGEMLGLDFRIKPQESFVSKIERDYVDYEIKKASNPNLPEKTREDFAKEIKDTLRYTASFKEENFVESTIATIKGLLDDGVEIVNLKNTWQPNQPYKGINGQFKKDGIIFELQFHTPLSFEIKEKVNHKFFEARRLLKADENNPRVIADIKTLDYIMSRNASKIPQLEGIERITKEAFEGYKKPTSEEITYNDLAKSKSFTDFDKNKDKTLAKIESDTYNQLIQKLPKRQRSLLNNIMQDYDKQGEQAPNFMRFTQDRMELLTDAYRRGDASVDDVREAMTLYNKFYNTFVARVIREYKPLFANKGGKK